MNKEKIKKFFSNLWKWIIKPFLWIGGIAGAIFGAIFGVRKIYELAVLNKVSYESGTHWNEIDKTTISVYDKYNNQYVRRTLPKDRRTNKQITTDDIKAVGISEPGGKINVEIKHNSVTDGILNNADNGG